MAAYSYKYVRDMLPPFVTEAITGYEGDPGYDGDQWVAAADYIELLEKELAGQFAQTGAMGDERLLSWLTTRERGFYCDGPAIPREPAGSGEG